MLFVIGLLFEDELDPLLSDAYGNMSGMGF